MNARFVRLSLLFVLTATLTVPALLSPRAARADANTTMSNMRVPIDFIATSCSGETVIISGESHVVVHSTTNSAGQVLLSTHIQFHLDGETPGGNRYIANETVEGTETFNPSDAYHLTSVGQLHLVAQGSADNLVVRTIIHTTVNANGEITNVTFEFDTQCQG